MKTSFRKTLFILVPLSLLFLSFNCSDDGDDEEYDCNECIAAQEALCEAYAASNCKDTPATEKAEERVLNSCPDGAEKVKYVHLRCWRADTSECSAQSYSCP